MVQCGFMKGDTPMGMTDKQFEYHLLQELRYLEELQAELAEDGIVKSKLDKKINDLKSQLNRP